MSKKTLAILLGASFIGSQALAEQPFDKQLHAKRLHNKHYRPTAKGSHSAPKGSFSFFDHGYIELGAGYAKPANKVDSYYFGGEDGTQDSYEKKRLKGSDIYRLSLGRQFGENYRWNIDLFYGNKHKYSKFTDYSGGEVESFTNRYKVRHLSGLLGGYYDIARFGEKFRPYLGLGAGFSHNHITREPFIDETGKSESYKKSSRTSFAWSAAVGARYHMNDTTYLDLSYRYLDLGRLKGATTRILGDGSSEQGLPNVKGRLRSNVFMLAIGRKF